MSYERLHGGDTVTAAFLKRRVREIETGIEAPTGDSGDALKGGDGGGTSGDMEARVAKVETAVGKMEGVVEGLKSNFTILSWGIGLLMAVMLGGFTIMIGQVNRLDGKIDAVSFRLAEEFKTLRSEMAADARAMRVETAAQTSAIANSITAARQVQPQIMVMPPTAPQPAPPPAPQQPPAPARRFP